MRRRPALAISMLGSLVMLVAIAILLEMQRGDETQAAAGAIVTPTPVDPGSCALSMTAPTSSDPDTAPISPAGFDAPPGFATPGYVPAGYSLRSVEQSRKSDTVTRISRGFENADNAELYLTEAIRPSGLSSAEKAGEQIELSASAAYCRRYTVTFATGRLVVSITAPELSREEVLRVAESMR